MNITGMQVYWASDLKDYGYTEDGEKFIGYVYFVEVENARGDRWRLNRTFDGVKPEQWEEGIAYVDVRDLAIARCDALVAAIRQTGSIDLAHWHQASCAYGSEAYMDYGQAEELAWERQSLRNEMT
jgi:hypothetical protein